MLALAALVNGSYPAETRLPSLAIAPVTARAETIAPLTAAGNTLKDASLWNGEKLPTSVNLDLVPASSTDSDTTSKSSLAGTEAEATLAVAAPKAVVEAKVALSSASVKQAVETYFSDIPVMVKIAGCESQFRQYDASGNVLHGKVNYMDRGVMQINESYHEKIAASLGYDIMSLQGNMAYARYLYDEQGTRPWLSSSACWAGSDNTQVAQK